MNAPSQRLPWSDIDRYIAPEAVYDDVSYEAFVALSELEALVFEGPSGEGYVEVVQEYHHAFPNDPYPAQGALHLAWSNLIDALRAKRNGDKR